MVVMRNGCNDDGAEGMQVVVRKRGDWMLSQWWRWGREEVVVMLLMEGRNDRWSKKEQLM